MRDVEGKSAYLVAHGQVNGDGLLAGIRVNPEVVTGGPGDKADQPDPFGG